MFKTRPSKVSDIGFIYSTWLKSYKYDSPLTKYTKQDLFYKQHQKILDKLLSSPNVTIVIACHDQDEDLNFGYIVYEPSIIHYIYVKGPFRGYGIAKKLLSDVQGSFQASHLTYSLLDLWTAKKIQCDYNPYILGAL